MPEIEKNVPMPESGLRADITRLLNDGEVGDSMFFEGEKQSTVASTCNQVGGKGTFTTKQEEKQGEFGSVQGVRVWLKSKPDAVRG